MTLGEGVALSLAMPERRQIAQSKNFNVTNVNTEGGASSRQIGALQSSSFQ